MVAARYAKMTPEERSAARQNTPPNSAGRV